MQVHVGKPATFGQIPVGGTFYCMDQFGLTLLLKVAPYEDPEKAVLINAVDVQNGVLVSIQGASGPDAVPVGEVTSVVDVGGPVT